ncbi:hypothetical protein CY34DRAFT_812032 [Suillus luteus UH-Slu-Lm8-n1]|uniref:Uncharacterized protein n=1 Tax=Suillus luteus UH-Slu-Lm8-n1 TaxID=930992 RepID=A0A0D0AUN8_9AGAM|nr:hypothetical protein CY34DRAFT_812032 [Suillus luteus UH-Slu-Lm8-n1]
MSRSRTGAPACACCSQGLHGMPQGVRLTTSLLTRRYCDGTGFVLEFTFVAHVSFVDRETRFRLLSGWL